MTTCISILRGINVGGQKKIQMTNLKSLYEELGVKNVRTYIQSGNIIFESNEQKELVQHIEQKIFEKYNFHVPVIIRTIDEMEIVLNNNPFLNENNIDESKLHVTFLGKLSSREHIKKIETYNYYPDRFIISEKEVYLYCPNGYGRTKLNNTFFENKLKITATTRNWNTVKKLSEMAKN